MGAARSAANIQISRYPQHELPLAYDKNQRLKEAVLLLLGHVMTLRLFIWYPRFSLSLSLNLHLKRPQWENTFMLTLSTASLPSLFKLYSSLSCSFASLYGYYGKLILGWPCSGLGGGRWSELVVRVSAMRIYSTPSGDGNCAQIEEEQIQRR